MINSPIFFVNILFATAIENITGTPLITAMKSAEKEFTPLKLLDRGFSKFDKNKRKLLINAEISGLTPFEELVKENLIVEDYN